jgi:hypothetical protein
VQSRKGEVIIRRQKTPRKTLTMRRRSKKERKNWKLSEHRGQELVYLKVYLAFLLCTYSCPVCTRYILTV